MDKSADYIKMCEQAKEIQKAWNPEEGDFYASLVPYGFTGVITQNKLAVFVFAFYEGVNRPERLKYSATFLPRQDQLQKMVEERNGDILSQLQAIWIFTNSFKKESVSFEQLWLEAVMYWKYNKKWNGTEWKKIGNL